MTRRLVVRAGLLLGSLVLAACQPLPHPFETEHDLPEGRLMAMPDVVGIAVDPVRGVSTATSESLRGGLVKALQDADIPASAAPAGEHSYHILGQASAVAAQGGMTRVGVTWTVTDAAGDVLGRHPENFVVDTSRLQAGTADLAAPMQTAASEIAGTLHLPGAAPPPALKPVPPSVRLVLGPVTGAPGDGDSSLPRALAFVLQDAGITILDQPDLASPRVGAKVTVTPFSGGQERVKIVWTVSGPDGKSVGTVAQENAVPKGSLDGPWSDAAAAVAAAAADAIRGLAGRAMQPGNMPQ